MGNGTFCQFYPSFFRSILNKSNWQLLWLGCKNKTKQLKNQLQLSEQIWRYPCILLLLLCLGLHQKVTLLLLICSVFHVLLKFFKMSHALCRHLFNEEPRKVMEKIKSYHWSQQRSVVFILADALNSVVFSLFSAARTTAFIFSSSSPLFLFGFVRSASVCWTCCSSALILQMWPPIHLHFVFHAHPVNCRFESSW